MKGHQTETELVRRHDKQLRGIALYDVLEKRRLGQPLNAKEFAVCTGLAYSKTRNWFHLPGFPVFDGVVFWRDFIQWRAEQFATPTSDAAQTQDARTTATAGLPPRAAQILLDS